MQQQPIAAPPQVSVTPTDVAQIYKNSQDAALAAYQAQLGQRNAMWKNLTTLGSAGIGRRFRGPASWFSGAPYRLANRSQERRQLLVQGKPECLGTALAVSTGFIHGSPTRPRA
jgi:hypothetical protein